MVGLNKIKNKTMKGQLKLVNGTWVIRYEKMIHTLVGNHDYKTVTTSQDIDLHPYDYHQFIEGIDDGKEVEFKIVSLLETGLEKDYKVATILESNELSDWDVTLLDGIENEPYVSDNFQIGPDGAFEYTEDEDNEVINKSTIQKLTEEEWSAINNGIPRKTEISDEEYYKDVFYQKQVMNPYSTGEQSHTAYEKGFIDGAYGGDSVSGEDYFELTFKNN
jgi:hypothetical protein